MFVSFSATILTSINDSCKVRLGGYAPSLKTADMSKVRLGGYAPALSTTDTGKVRLGGYAPALPARK